MTWGVKELSRRCIAAVVSGFGPVIPEACRAIGRISIDRSLNDYLLTHITVRAPYCNNTIKESNTLF